MKELYVFDFDDTLMWAPYWQAEATLDKNNFVIAPGRSHSIEKALNYLEKFVDFNLQLRRDLTLRKEYYFVITDIQGEAVMPNKFSNYIQEQFRGLGFYVNQYQIELTNDPEFYRILETVGTEGINIETKEMFLKHGEESLILTARFDDPGMKEKIKESLKENLLIPQDIFLRPLNHKQHGKFKGETLSKLFELHKPDMLYFYDDNPDYIQGAKKYLQYKEYYSQIQCNLLDISHKPTPIFQVHK